jgi:hypothetical protein
MLAPPAGDALARGLMRLKVRGRVQGGWPVLAQLPQPKVGNHFFRDFLHGFLT